MRAVIFVDDEPYIREGLHMFADWSKLGYTVAGESQDGPSAFELIKKVRPALVICDIRLPVISGLDVFERIKSWAETEAHIEPPTFLMLSGYNDFEYARKAMKLGAAGYLTKPIDPDELVTEIMRISAVAASAPPDCFFSLPYAQVTDAIKNGDEKDIRNAINLFFSSFHSFGVEYSYSEVALCRLSDLITRTAAECGVQGETQAVTLKHPSICDLQCTIPRDIQRAIPDDIQRTIPGDIQHTIPGDIQRTIPGDIQRTIPGDIQRTIPGDIQRTIPGDIQHTIPGDIQRTIHGDIQYPRYDDIQHTTLSICLSIMQKRRFNDQKVLTYIYEHCAENLTLSRLSEVFSVSGRQISGAVKALAGCKFNDYLHYCRIDTAKKLLAGSRDIKISTVCENTGYSDYVYFTLKFKKLTGMSPSAFKRQYA